RRGRRADVAGGRARGMPGAVARICGVAPARRGGQVSITGTVYHSISAGARLVFLGMPAARIRRTLRKVAPYGSSPKSRTIVQVRLKGNDRAGTNGAVSCSRGARPRTRARQVAKSGVWRRYLVHLGQHFPTAGLPTMADESTTAVVQRLLEALSGDTP